MKKNAKKKLFTLMLVIMLLSIAIVGGSLAWFTAEDEVTNTFTVGSIKVTQNETDSDGNAFIQNQFMLPIVNTITPSADDNYIEKVVTLTNDGKNEAYVRTWIAVPKELADEYLALDLDLSQRSGWIEVRHNPDWIVGEYELYCYYNENVLAPNEKTPALLNGVYLKPHTDVQANPNNNGVLEFCMWNPQTNAFVFSGFPAYASERPVEVVVITQAVQAEGFNNALEALNRAFGMPSETNNPFVTN